MSKYGKCDFSQLKKFEKQFRKLEDEQIQQFYEDFAKELAARLLAKVIKRTPVGETTRRNVQLKDRDGNLLTVKKGKNKGKIKTKIETSHIGGELRRGWTAGKRSRASAFAEEIKVNKVGNTYIIEIKNPVHYASYVEKGHRTRNKKGWVKGRFMLKISEEQISQQLPALLEKRVSELFKEVF